MSRAAAKSPPIVVVIAGPNGAGKTTIAKRVLADTLGIDEFVNADTIAQGLSGFRPERAAFAAGRVMLARLHELGKQGGSFAFESTLASRTFAPWLRDRIATGYQLHILYVMLATPALAIARVRRRVRSGGHSVPPDVVRRRFARSAWNFLELYQPLATTWKIFDNSRPTVRLVAEKGSNGNVRVVDQDALVPFFHAAYPGKEISAQSIDDVFPGAAHP